MALAYPSHPSRISSKPQTIETNGTRSPQLTQHSRLSLTYTTNGPRQAALTRLGAAPMMLFGPLLCSRWDEIFCRTNVDLPGSLNSFRHSQAHPRLRAVRNGIRNP